MEDTMPMSAEEVQKWRVKILNMTTELNSAFMDPIKSQVKSDPRLQNLVFFAQMHLQEFGHWLNDAAIVVTMATPEAQEQAQENAIAKGQIKLVQ